jgi:lipoprotein signal peptidase
MNFKKVRLFTLIASGLFFLPGQILKWQAFYYWTKPHLIFPYFGWQIFLNSGVAFGLPLANSLTIIITLPIIGLIGCLFFHELTKKDLSKPNILLAWSMVFVGAISNLLDRIIYSQVVDYFIIGTALINISDILIVVGLVIYLLQVKRQF